VSVSQHYRTVWLSDIHLGSKDCKVDYLIDFLDQVECGTLILVGDIIDLWSLSRKSYWPASHTRVLELICAKALAGCKVVYVPGNHDCTLRRFTFLLPQLVTITKRHQHETADGRSLLVTHGDEFDSAVCLNPLLNKLGDTSYDLLLFLNRSFHRIQRWLGWEYWSLAGYVKSRVHNANIAIGRFRHAAKRLARLQGHDGIVCGHIHHPEICNKEGLLYCNTGDWIENCSALTERMDGSLELIRWTESTSVLTRFNDELDTRMQDAA